MRVGVVQIIGDTKGNGAAAGEVAGSLGHGDLPALIGIEVYVGAVAIDGHGNELFDGCSRGWSRGGHGQRVFLEADDGGIRAGAND